jgi:hypothetical protein
VSKQLALSIVFSVMTMSGFALATSAVDPANTSDSKHTNGAVAEAAAPSVISEFLAK